jgi:hypothetical protein
MGSFHMGELSAMPNLRPGHPTDIARLALFRVEGHYLVTNDPHHSFSLPQSHPTPQSIAVGSKGMARNSTRPMTPGAVLCQRAGARHPTTSASKVASARWRRPSGARGPAVQRARPHPEPERACGRIAHDVLASEAAECDSQLAAPAQIKRIEWVTSFASPCSRSFPKNRVQGRKVRYGRVRVLWLFCRDRPLDCNARVESAIKAKMQHTVIRSS